MFYYLDDWFIVAESRSLLSVHCFLVLQKEQDLGFLINWKKLSLDPQRVPVYLGAALDIPRRLAQPAEHRVVALKVWCENWHQRAFRRLGGGKFSWVT